MEQPLFYYVAHREPQRKIKRATENIIVSVALFISAALCGLITSYCNAKTILTSYLSFIFLKFTLTRSVLPYSSITFERAWLIV
jgi:hypothetical protein